VSVPRGALAVLKLATNDRLLSEEVPGAEHRSMSDDEIRENVTERHPGWNRNAPTRILRQAD